MVGSRITPNHLTTLRLLSGIGACACFAVGSRTGMAWGGAVWLVSALLDRADGELARLGGLSSPGGHIYDYYVDIGVNALFFMSVGIGLRHSWLSGWAVPLGLVSCAGVLLSSVFCELLEQRSPPDTKAYSGRWGFDPDDALYLMGPLAWLGWLGPILIGAAIGAPAVVVLTGIRLFRLTRSAA
jgi:phosphatidylglycerophosphate synthase